MSEMTTVATANRTGGLAAALWDFDGTLADTEPMWIAAEYELVARLGGTWSDEQAHSLIGSDLLHSGAYIVDALGRADLTPAWVRDQLINQVVSDLRTRPMPWRPGARELLAAFGAAGIPCALVSASYRVLLEPVLEQLPAGSFTVSVAGDEVTRGKPDPEPYAKAAAALGVDSRDCVVFEDSITGARSGNASGALVIAVPTRVPVPPAPRRVLRDSLVGLDPVTVAALLEQADDLG